MDAEEPPDEADEFIWTGEHGDAVPRSAGQFPPDDLLELPAPLSFARLLAALALVAAAADAARVGYPYTGIPYNYPAAGAVLYALLAIRVLGRVHAALDTAGRDLAAIARRTTAEATLRPRSIDHETITGEFASIREQAFHPAVLLGGAAIGAGVAVWAVFRLGLTVAYPYHGVTAIYGAAHGLFVAPAVAAVVLGARIADRYAVGFDAAAPDGAGGYRRVGRALATVVADGTVLVSLDLAVVASVGYVRPGFLSAALGAYGLSLVLLFALAVAGTVAIERRLRCIRDRTAAAMRGRFDEAAAEFWDATARGGDPVPAGDAIRTMAALFDHLRRSSPWPLGRWSVARLLGAATLAILVAAVVLARVPGAPGIPVRILRPLI